MSFSLAYQILDEAEDEDVNKEYAVETNRDVVMIAAAKLIANDVVPKVNCYFVYVKLWIFLFFMGTRISVAC